MHVSFPFHMTCLIKFPPISSHDLPQAFPHQIQAKWSLVRVLYCDQMFQHLSYDFSIKIQTPIVLGENRRSVPVSQDLLSQERPFNVSEIHPITPVVITNQCLSNLAICKTSRVTLSSLSTESRRNAGLTNFMQHLAQHM